MDSYVSKVANLLGEEFVKLTGVSRDAQIMRSELIKMHAVFARLADVEREIDPQVKEIRAQLMQISIKIEELIDEVKHHHRLRNGAKAGSVHETATRIKASRAQHQIDNKVTLLKSRFWDLSERMRRYEVVGNDTCASRSKAVAVENRLMMFYTGTDGLVGVDGPVRELSNWLMTGPEQTKLKVASIAGFAGLGKTTLAHEVYRCLGEQFQCRAFAVVSRDSDIRRVLMSILTQVEPIQGSHQPGVDIYYIICKIREFLADKRYLVVIDDVCSVEDWKIIKQALPTNDHGSRIITTTRINSAAAACCCDDGGFIYKIKPLSAPDSERLFVQRLFGTNDACPPPLTEVCNEILRMCGGMPLEILCIASMLSCQAITKQSCEEVVNSLRFGSITGADMEYLKEILYLSYLRLPHDVRTCLLYLSIFPVNHTMDRDCLVKKWIAQGFVNQEQEASQYFDELINNNVIQPVECNNNCDQVITYHIHPMMHHLLKVTAEQQNFATLLHYKDTSSSDGMYFCHLSIDCPDPYSPIDSSSTASQHCRSLTVFGHANRFLLKNFEGMRVLDLEGCKSIETDDLKYICTMVLLKQLVLKKTQIIELPPQIGNLQNLERLDVGETQITKLPPEIGELQYLETLDASKSGVKELPDEVVRLKRLVHLLVGDKDSSEGVKLLDAIGKLTSLQQLCTIDLKKCSICSLKELGKLTELKELSVVSNDGPDATDKNSTLLSSLQKSTMLQSLVVYGDFSLKTMQSSSPYNCLMFRKKLTVVRSLNVPMFMAAQSYLGVLDIRVCKLEEKDLKILRELPSLQSLTVRLEILPRTMVHISCEGFASLESFCVDCRMPRVIFEEGAMAKLKHLELKLYAGSASEDPMGIKHLLSLEKVLVRYSRWYASNKGVKETVAAMGTEAKEHQNRITLCIAEENKDGSCSTTTEIVRETKDASCSMTTEIEAKEERHAGGTGPIQKNYASCSGTNEIVVVE